jgi:hypothetical protein
VPDFSVPGMHLHLDERVDWEGLLTLRQGPSADVEAEVGADPARTDIAESFIRRRSHAVEDGARRIEDCAEDRLERDARLVERIAPA